MKWILFAVFGLAALVAIVTIVGARLPREHRASRTLRVPRVPADVWAVATRLAGSASVPVDVVESEPPHRLVTRVKASEQQFGGSWTIIIVPVVDGSTLTITEDGWVASPIFRFVSRYVIGHHATMDALLKSVAKELNAQAALSGE